MNLPRNALATVSFVDQCGRRSNHGVWMPQGWRVRYTKWKKFERVFSNGDTQGRYIREIVFGKRHHLRYWQITTDPVELPENCTWFIMTNLVGDIQKSVGGRLFVVPI
ncbi:MAG TPA: hypothetical protein DDZ80_26085 [Cyanobacteria bacterium UBA8803]|nr:hypothetical protein [Cyanobacteria bacterium UBA9273]HBL61757.1 hypothetical protein [Cyanobacteria bacterium UBA8803]